MKLFVVVIAIVTVAQPADLDAVLEKLDSYLEKYESELSAVVADEELVQETDGRLAQTDDPGGCIPRSRLCACPPASSGWDFGTCNASTASH